VADPCLHGRVVVIDPLHLLRRIHPPHDDADGSIRGGTAQDNLSLVEEVPGIRICCTGNLASREPNPITKITEITKITKILRAEDNKDNKDNTWISSMPMKTCAVCGRPVYKNTGTYFAGLLVHQRCVPRAETIWFRLRRRRR